MNKIIVLGAGMVGSAMAIDMAQKHDVTVSDIDNKVLANVSEKCNKLKTLNLNVAIKSDLIKALQPFDLVICAVPGFLGFKTLKTIIEAKKNVIDISFFPENAFELDKLAKENKVTAIVDCGVAPGMGNVILGYYNEKLKLTDFECLVGGLPKQKKWPFCYKAPFSPVDVIEEYTRPARYVENGIVVTRDALSDCEYIDFDRVGTLESFNSDGLRSIIQTMPHILNMKEKTLRYPGHVEYIKVLKSSGFFNQEKISVNNVDISPLEFTSKILFDEWKLGENEKEITVMRITLKGENSEGKTEKVIYNLFDEYCTDTKVSSMSRTTGYTATAAANLFLDGVFSDNGIFPTELVGQLEESWKYLMY